MQTDSPTAAGRVGTQVEPLAPSPVAAASFLGAPDNLGSIPPDTHGAVGPSHIVVAVNNQVRILRRDGSTISSVTLTNFWRAGAGISVAGRAFDPRVLYDHSADRWIIVSVSDSRAATSSVLVGVSLGGDPTGAWKLYQIDADTTDILWADYPSVGFDKDWIVVQANMFPVVDGTGSFTSNVYVFGKANLYAAGAGAFTAFKRADIGGTQTPAVTFGDAPAFYLVSNWNSTAGVLQIYTITGAIGAESLTRVAQAVAPESWSSAPPAGSEEFAPQLGASRRIATNDSRIHSVVYRNGSLWCVQTVTLATATPNARTAVQWWELAPGGAVRQRGRIDDSSAANFYAFPSIAVNKNNDVLVGYTRFSASQYASAHYAFRAGTDPAGTLRDDTQLKAGEGPYDKDFGAGRNRWGDYSATVVDPVNDTDMWTLQEFAAAPSGTGAGSGRWGVWWGRVGLAPAPGAPPANPIDNAQFFVGQHYRDFFNREGDAGGVAYWSAQIAACGADAGCIEDKRADVSAAFFISIEFQNTGYLVHRFSVASFPENLPRYAAFVNDLQRIGAGVVVGQAGWESQLESNKQSFAADWVARADFLARYPPGMSADAYVNALFANSGVAPTSAERLAAIGEYGTGGAHGRARALRSVAESASVYNRQYNSAFVLMQYFGYLRRDPDTGGFNFWLAKLNEFDGDFRRAEMVKAFISSGEYRRRFGAQ